MFTYNDWSAGTEYDYMVKAAVSSAIDVARMRAFCMYSGGTESPMYQWFVSKGVAIIQVGCGWVASGRPPRSLRMKGQRYIANLGAAYACVEGCLGPRGSPQSRVQCQGGCLSC